MFSWFKWALGATLAGSLLTAPFSNSLPTGAQTKITNPIFETTLAQLHLQAMPAEPQPTQTPEPPTEADLDAVDCRKQKCIALTFDDGPAHNTLGILASLEKYGAKATFFAIGLELRQHPEIAKQIVAQGHELGGHSYSHRNLRFLSETELQNDFNYVAKLMELATGTRPVIFRPPFGEYDHQVISVARQPLILWSVDPKDWLTRDSDETYRRVVSDAHPGAIVVLHDYLLSTKNAVPKILKTLSARGYKFVTVSQLLGELSKGEVYKAGPDVKE